MLEGHLLDERYLIKKTIGGGGMANVYLATDTILNRDIAVKVLRLEYANDEEFIERFHREAQAATSLSHPNIVNIFDVGEEEHILYMAMEYVDGLTLKEYIQRYGPIGVEESLNIMQQVTSAIAHAHENDLVHRDIKPQNILMDGSGQVKVTDFGIAIALSATSLTRTNSILGSVHYLSPEQARGGMATKKSDIYSLGIVLFELLTGKLPFSGQSPVSIALKHLQSDPPSVRTINPSIPQSVENIVLQAMAKDPFHRYQDVTEMHYALEHAMDPHVVNQPIFAPPVEVGEETKAIPVITDDHIQTENDQETMIHRTDAQTIRVDPNHMKNEKTTNKKANKGKKKSKKKKWVWIGIALFVVILAAVLALFLLPSLFKLKEVTIPDVIEDPIDEAITELEELNLVVKEESVVDEDVEEGYVVKTDPKAGRTVKEESIVTIYVSEGKEKEEMDNYVGLDFTQAKRLLEDKGFTDIIQYDEHSDKPEGEIISQVQPDSGSLVIPSDTRVIFEVSIGPEAFQLKDLVGSSLSDAESYAEEHGLTLSKEEVYSESVEKGLITKQDPGASSSVKKGSTINVYVSLGAEEKPPNFHTVTFSVPYTNEPEEDEEGEDDNNNQEKEPQTVTIYVEDMNNKLEDVYKQETITEDKEYSITLTIKKGDSAKYRVERDGEMIIEKEIP